MDLGLSGKVAMVAAGSKGIGLGIAKMLAQEGCRVSICGRTEENLAKAFEDLPGTVRGYVCDVSKAEDLERWFESTSAELGKPAILVTNTGGPPAGKWSDMTDEQWMQGIDSTLLNVVRLSRLATPGMLESGWGRIVHITSLVAKEPNPLLPISSTLRTGLMALCRLQALELAPNGITVNSVLPGHTSTDRQTHLAEKIAEQQGITVEQALKGQEEKVPIGRFVKVEELAATVAFLCSNHAAAITGVNLLVDGGVTKTFA